jgi:protease-4
MSNGDVDEERSERRKRAVDVIVRAVTTGIFILSIFLNVVFLIVIIVLVSLLGTAKYKDVAAAGYRKVYEDSGPFVSRGMKNELAIVYLSGFITEARTHSRVLEYSEDPVSAVKNRLDIIEEDENIKGVLLVIDSPGGSVTASDALYRAIVKFKEKTGLPVISMMKQIAASGGYYVAAATDYIVAQPTTVTGSIGVIMFNFNIKGLMDKYGVEYIAIKTGKYKDILSPFKQSEEDEISWMQDIVEQMHEQFINAVEQGRPNLSREEILALSDGRVYLAKDALRLGLIDEVGYFEDAVSILSERSRILEPTIIEFEKERTLRDFLGRVVLRLRPGNLADIFNIDRYIYEESYNPYGIYFLWDGILNTR